MSAADLATAGATEPRPVPPARRRGRVSTRLLWSEMRLIGGRRRNQAGLLVLAAVPIFIAVAVKISSPRSGHGPDFLSSITSNGLFVPLAALSVELGMFLPLAISMLSGDAIAGEANIGTLRYLLTVPVGRSRLLLVKYASLVIGAVWGVLAVVVPGAIIGIALFGTGKMTTLSGTQIGLGDAVWRLLLASLYVAAGLAALAAIGLFISSLTEQPIAAAIALMIVTAAMWILVSVDQVAWLHPWLIVDHFTAFGDLLRDPIAWSGMRDGLLLDLGYAVVFWLAAWARFSGKDITS
jgi:ABC-2 type transport system permease protein